MKRSICAFVVLAVLASVPVWSQTASSGERTVEESYLQDPLETMIIREQAYSDSKDMKLVALQYIRQALEEGRASPEVRKALEYLALESSTTVIRAGGVGRVLNNYPDVRREACLMLGEIKTVEAKDALLKVALADNEPMVIAAALRSIGKIGIMDGDDVTQTIAFVGPSGAGKSTLFDLVLRFYDPNGGRVSLDGSDIREFVPSEYRKLFSWVPQDPTLFSMSIAENISFGTSLPRDAIERAARVACIHDFIAALPDGYDTALGERGVNLSGGQVQRLALDKAGRPVRTCSEPASFAVR
ncbi:MAG TPA: ATP-binding cassette domain-containing protein, partial [Spirochaetales bacterium]|nr:ATP-binding cassette domain-containing protein [Spirochaetales bacterium]